MQLMSITSRNNPTVVWAASLKEKKYREAHGCFLAEGKKLVKEAIDAGLPITHLLISEEKTDEFLSLAESLMQTKSEGEPKIFLLSAGCLEKISTEKSPQGVIAVIKHLDFFQRCIKINMKDILPTSRCLALCSVRDPGNLGSVIRSAVAFGTDTLLLSDDCADVYNPKTVRAAMGSLFRVRVFYIADMQDALAALMKDGRHVYAAELTENALPVSRVDITEKDVFVIGNEGHGIPHHISTQCTNSVYIPIEADVESLNASVAASILLWEQKRTRKD